ncbi:MAG: proton-conducting transporter transmembrane domain-containing protein [Isosphaeraceae bacterium]
MRFLEVPWLEFSIATTLIGALWVSQIREPYRAARMGLVFTGSAFVFAFLAWLDYYVGIDTDSISRASLEPYIFGREVFVLDELSAPLVPAVALLHFLTALATPRNKMRRFSNSWSLVSEAIRLAMFSCKASWLLVGLLAVCTVPPYFELKNRVRLTRVYVLHMGLFVGLMVVGWAGVAASAGRSAPPTWATVLLMAAILVRCGTVPAHCWVTDWFEHTSFGIAMLFVTPLAGVYAAVRLVLPIAPDWVLQSIGLSSLVTAVYAAGMAVIQRDCRRLFANLFLSHASLVLVGLELHTEISLTASLCLWFSVILSLGGFGLTIRAMEARFGRLSLTEYQGLYQHSPALAVCFLLTGLACVGFPGTLGFISTELLVDSAVEVSPYVGIAVVTAAALNGIAVVRAYLLIFTGARHHSTVLLGIGDRERFAVLTFSALILGGGFFPQPGVSTRHRAAATILAERRKWSGLSAPDSAAMPAGRPEFGPARPAVTPVAAATDTARHDGFVPGPELDVGR